MTALPGPIGRPRTDSDAPIGCGCVRPLVDKDAGQEVLRPLSPALTSRYGGFGRVDNGGQMENFRPCRTKRPCRRRKGGSKGRG